MHAKYLERSPKGTKKGIQQLFLSDPLLFSNLLFEGREHQFKQAQQNNAHWVFFDRGIPDVYAYLDYSKASYPHIFKEKAEIIDMMSFFYSNLGAQFIFPITSVTKTLRNLEQLTDAYNTPIRNRVIR